MVYGVTVELVGGEEEHQHPNIRPDMPFS